MRGVDVIEHRAQGGQSSIPPVQTSLLGETPDSARAGAQPPSNNLRFCFNQTNKAIKIVAATAPGLARSLNADWKCPAWQVVQFAACF